jgi:hypothetical protein
MLERWLAVGALVSSLLLLSLTSAPREIEPTASPRVAPAPFPTHGNRIFAATAAPAVLQRQNVGADTIQADAAAGTPLVLSLPSEIGEAPVARYTVLQGPSLCGVAGRSFTWITEGTDPGTHDIRLRAHHPDAQPDTLVVRIELTK